MRGLIISILFSLSLHCYAEIVRFANIKEVDENIEGEVEIYYENMWRPLCARMWSKSDAHVVCKTIGFEKGAAANKRNDLMGQSKRRYFYYLFLGLECNGSEVNIEKCANWNKNVMTIQTCSNGIAIAVCKR